MIPYGKHNINAVDIKSVTKVLKSDFITQGKQIEIFEKKNKKISWSKICRGSIKLLCWITFGC